MIMELVISQAIVVKTVCAPVIKSNNIFNEVVIYK